jgi:hypothetical protein
MGEQGVLLLVARGGVGEHYYVQKCYYEQSEVMKGMGLREEQSEVTKRMLL